MGQKTSTLINNIFRLIHQDLKLTPESFHAPVIWALNYYPALKVHAAVCNYSGSKLSTTTSSNSGH